MSVCAKVIPTACGPGVHIPCGEFVLALDTATTDLATCAYVVDTGADYSGLKALMNLTIPDAELIGGQIALLWGIVWGIKQIGKAILANNQSPERD